tara:strand:+ start:356 stop:709 length:354 start_codon:yes stop_codon:yes gene_type:complete
MLYCTDFRYDLKRGQEAERWLGGLLEGDTIEVKRDFIAHKTNRVYVEFECNAKPSGIKTTEAELWAFVTDICTIIIPTERLRLLVEDAIKQKKYSRGGDGHRSVGALIDLKQLVTSK